MNKKELKVLSDYLERKLSEDFDFVILNNKSVYNFTKENSGRVKSKEKLYQLLVNHIKTNHKEVCSQIEYDFSKLIKSNPTYRLPLKVIESRCISEVSSIPAIKSHETKGKINTFSGKIESIRKVLEYSPIDSVIYNIHEQESAKDATGHFILCLLTSHDERFSYEDKRFYFNLTSQIQNGKTKVQLSDIKSPLRNVFKKINKIESLEEFKSRIIEHSSDVALTEISKTINSFDKSLNKLASSIGIHDYSLLMKELVISIEDKSLKEAISELSSGLTEREDTVKSNLIQSLKDFGLSQSKLKDFYQDRGDMKITLYCGETNSGKTYQSFKHIKGASSGIYMAPLRLLAMEGKEHIESFGHKCNLVTGDYQEIEDGANFTSSTVEMLDSSKHHDVAILDEVQLIFDQDRGWAWTQALLSVQANELVLTGNLEIAPHIEAIAEYMCCELEIIYLEKKTKLERFEHEVFDFDDIPDNSAIITFSKRDVIQIKEQYEKTTGKKASVIFGALTPKLRKIESDKFRNGETQIVVATDAISMGLNLPIQYVFFSSLEKYDGKSVGFIEKDLALQIIGRAGRYMMFNKGYYGVFNCEDITLDAILSKPSPRRRSVFPYKVPFKILEVLSLALNINDIYKLLNIYVSYIDIDDPLFDKMKSEDQIKKAMLIEQIDHDGILSLAEKYKLINAPITISQSNEFIFNESVTRLVHGVDFEEFELPNGDVKINSIRSLDNIEINLSAIDFYLWLSYSFCENFGNHSDRMEHVKEILNKKLTKFLSSRHSESFNCLNECGAKVPLMNKYCEKCKDSFNI